MTTRMANEMTVVASAGTPIACGSVPVAGQGSGILPGGDQIGDDHDFLPTPPGSVRSWSPISILRDHTLVFRAAFAAFRRGSSSGWLFRRCFGRMNLRAGGCARQCFQEPVDVWSLHAGGGSGEMAEFFQVVRGLLENDRPRFNIRPTQNVLTVPVAFWNRVRSGPASRAGAKRDSPAACRQRCCRAYRMGRF